MKKCHYFFFFLAPDLLTATQTQNLPLASETQNIQSVRSRAAWRLSGVRKDAVRELEERQCFFLFTADLTHCVLPTLLFLLLFFMRLWNRPRLSFPVNDFISSLDCCLGCGLVCIYFNYEQWKSALAARLVAPTGTKLFLLRRET